jgi:hypothetical protein
MMEADVWCGGKRNSRGEEEEEEKRGGGKGGGRGEKREGEELGTSSFTIMWGHTSSLISERVDRTF